MVAQLPLGQSPRQYPDGRYFQYAGLFTFTTARAMLRMDLGQKQGVPTAPPIMLGIQGQGLVNLGTTPVTDIAAQTQIVETGLLINEYGQAHTGLSYIGELRVKGPTWTSLDAGQILTHLTGHLSRLVIGGSGGNGAEKAGQVEGVIGTGPYAESAAQTRGEKIPIKTSTRRPKEDLGGSPGLTGPETGPYAKQGRTAGGLGPIRQKLAATRLSYALGLVSHSSHPGLRPAPP